LFSQYYGAVIVLNVIYIIAGYKEQVLTSFIVNVKQPFKDDFEALEGSRINNLTDYMNNLR
jgi:hypothetical protein